MRFLTDAIECGSFPCSHHPKEFEEYSNSHSGNDGMMSAMMLPRAQGPNLTHVADRPSETHPWVHDYPQPKGFGLQFSPLWAL